jgi:hypothetical protein
VKDSGDGVGAEATSLVFSTGGGYAVIRTLVFCMAGSGIEAAIFPPYFREGFAAKGCIAASEGRYGGERMARLAEMMEGTAAAKFAIGEAARFQSPVFRKR